jgi:hypothetical protein
MREVSRELRATDTLKSGKEQNERNNRVASGDTKQRAPPFEGEGELVRQQTN